MLRRRPRVPVAKGRAFFESCELDAARLSFDPYDQSSHLCPKCGRAYSGEAFDLAWLRQFHDWLGKRLVEAGILYAVEGDERHAELVRHYLSHYVRRYRDYPLANNLLGPTRLFQSTYLEAFWLVDMVAAFDLTRSSPAYSDADRRGVRELLSESAAVVRSYDEGVSNRQAFNNAGMGAVGLLLEDQGLVDHVLTGPHGFSFHMRESLLEDGIWYEGENYHFATLDHTLNLAEMARHRGIDLYHGGAGLGSLKPMFDGPLKVMLPDLTFPSRKDSWFGRGMEFHRQVYELGYARYLEPRYGALLAHAYRNGVDRTDVGWRTFLHLQPELPEAGEAVRPRRSERMPGTGVAVLRRDEGEVYASLEYGHYGGGHGHPDRLHLTLFAGGVHWLCDPGTGWYHVPELGWYRSTIAHNTISVDGRLQLPREGELLAFGAAGGFRACQALVEEIAPRTSARRTLVLGPGFLLDVTDVAPYSAAGAGGPGSPARQIDWSFHTPGRLESPPASSGDSPPGDGDGYEFLRESRRVELHGGLDLTARHGTATLRVMQLPVPSVPAIAYLARAPGVPGREEWPLSSVIVRHEAAAPLRLATAWLWTHEKDEARFEAGAAGTMELHLGPRRFGFLIPPFGSGNGVAVATGAALAWFGLESFELGGVSVEGDGPLEWAALTRQADGTWRTEAPDAFGRLSIRGLPEGESVAGLAPASTTDVGPPRTVALEQAPGVVLWRESDAPLTIFAGVVNELSLRVGWYGVEPAAPAVELPSGWAVERLARSSRTGPVETWTLRIRVPSAVSEEAGEVRARFGRETFAIPFEVTAPLHTSWSLRSHAGRPALELEVRDLRGAGGRLGYRFDAPWPGGGTEGSEPLPGGGSARLTLPLPLAAPHPAGQAGEANAAAPGPVGPDDLVDERAQAGRAEGGWRLPGLAGSAGDWGVSARLELGEFTGTTTARLPLLWLGAEPGRALLGSEEQALWADRRWAGPDDASAEATLGLTPDGISLRCRVRDDRHVTDGSAEDLYENDSLQVYFDFRPDHHQDRNFAPGVAAYVVAPDATKRSATVRAIAGNREISNRGAKAAWFTTEGVTATSSPTPDGYLVEAHFPFASMGVDPLRTGDVIGFDLSVSDNDGTWYRNTQLLWSGSRGRRCYIRGSYHNPVEYGWLIVGE